MTNPPAGLRLAAIATAKCGLEAFTFRDLEYFESRGLAVELFPTKHAPGLFDPKPSWRMQRWSPAGVLARQLLHFARSPRRYAALLVEAVRYGALQEFALAWHFAAAVAANDLIWASFGDRKLFVGYFLKRITGLPLVVTTHAYELYDNPNPRLFPRALAACDRVITRTEHNRERLEEVFGLDPNEVALERNSLDLEAFRGDPKISVLIVGFFVERKAHDVLFEAIRSLARRDIEVWVVGDEGAEVSTDVRAMARDLGVEEQVVFFGRLPQPAVRALYRACDIFCLPSRFDRQGVAEGFPTALVEAMAMGKPVITTRHVEIPRVLDEVLVDENDVAGLAAAIERVAGSAELRAELGRRNRELAERFFPDRNREVALSLFREVAREGADASTSAPEQPRAAAGP